ncbi:MAG: isochorismatase family protein [Phycisphaera sp.]|nr:isochorismatase family protein [Phycisphaera sp.]
MPIPRLNPDSCALLVVDMQEKLLPAMHEPDRVLQRVGVLVDGFRVLNKPIIVTEQYPRGLGRTVPQLRDRLPQGTLPGEKLKFSACIEPVRKQLSDKMVRSVVVCGIEAHVCVLQTCLDLANLGFVVFVAHDAVSSRKAIDRDTALRRLEQAGVVPTTAESVLLELVHEAGTDAFKSVLPIIK